MKKNQLPGSIWKSPVQFLACGFGSGAMPYAPGTFGTLAAIPLYLLMHALSLPVYLGITVLLFLVGIWLCEKTARALGVHDHSGIVWDEIVGFLVTMTAIPFNAWWILLGFVFFRVFDIIKPWPIHWLDRRVPGGFGIMLDDVLAGIYAWVCVKLLSQWSALVSVIAGP